jgi:hypothetical protein
VRGYSGATHRDRRTGPRSGASVDLIFQIAAAQPAPVLREELTFTQGDRVYTPTEIIDQSGSRLHRLQGEAGRLEVRYEALIDGQVAQRATSDLEAITYLRPAATASPTRCSRRRAASSAACRGSSSSPP